MRRRGHVQRGVRLSPSSYTRWPSLSSGRHGGDGRPLPWALVPDGWLLDLLDPSGASDPSAGSRDGPAPDARATRSITAAASCAPPSATPPSPHPLIAVSVARPAVGVEESKAHKRARRSLVLNDGGVSKWWCV